MRYIFLLLITLTCQPALADGGLFDDGQKWPLVTDIGWSDERYLTTQVELIDELGRQRLGTPVRGNMGDIELLQRMVYRGLIGKDDKQTLQAMGAVLGNLMVQTRGLSWKVYEDEYGRSRAVCALDTDRCLFPVTMLSRRLKVGLVVDVQAVFDNAMELINPYLPVKPYQAR